MTPALRRARSALLAVWFTALMAAMTLPALADTTPAESKLKVTNPSTGVSTNTNTNSGKTTPAGSILEIPIPTIKFSEMTIQETGELRTGSIPWIAEYITGLYKYMVAVAAVVAAFVMVIGGFLWLTSGGDAARVEAAKKRISDAVLGLSLILGTYLILNAVNPNLATFNALKIHLVKQQLMPVSDFSDTAIDTSGSAPDPDAKVKTTTIGGKTTTTTGGAASASKPAGATQMAANCGGIVNITKAYQTEKPPGMQGEFYRKGCQKAWDMLKKAAAIIEKKGCTVIAGQGWGRSGMDQLNGVINRQGKLSDKCHVYYGCIVSMGQTWCAKKVSKTSTKEEDEAFACSTAAKRCWWTSARTADTSHKPFCDVTSVIHTEATDAWAIETSNLTGSYKKDLRYACGMDNVKCAKNRCQRELIRAWTSLGGGMLTNNANPRAFPISWESWHLCMNASRGCRNDADAAFAEYGL